MYQPLKSFYLCLNSKQGLSLGDFSSDEMVKMDYRLECKTADVVSVVFVDGIHLQLGLLIFSKTINRKAGSNYLYETSFMPCKALKTKLLLTFNKP